jgi:hypothetical protein
MKKQRFVVILIVSVLAVGLGGCSKFTRQRYETVYVGQPAWDVRRALGRPSSQDANAWVYVHPPAPYYRTVIRFHDGKVASKEWSYDKPSSSQPVGK